MGSPWCSNLRELIDFIALVVLCAPDDFIEEDFLGPEEQLNLERAFDELRHGLRCAAQEVGALPQIIEARTMLEEAYTHYREGRTNPGAWRLQDMEELLESI